MRKLLVLTAVMLLAGQGAAQAVGPKLTAPTPGLKIVQLRQFISNDRYVLSHPYKVVERNPAGGWIQLISIPISEQQKKDASAHLRWSQRLLSRYWSMLGNVSAWMCIHHYEGSWTDPNDPYWGGLQMDRSFMSTYGSEIKLAYGGRFADGWHPYDQIYVAQKAYASGRGYYPWPNTARYCGLI